MTTLKIIMLDFSSLIVSFQTDFFRKREGMPYFSKIRQVHIFTLSGEKNELVCNYFLRTSTHRHILEKLIILAFIDAETNA